jgi:transposase InsO family protein
VAASVAQPESKPPLFTDGGELAASGRAEVKAPSGSSVPLFAASSSQVAAVAASFPSSTSPVDLAALAAAQPSCPDCCRAPSSSVLRVTTIQMGNTSIMVDTSSGVFCPLVPESFRHPIFDVVHGLAHPGIRATRCLIASRFVWPGLASQVASWCRGCQHCQRAKAGGQPSSPPQAIANPVQRFSHLHVNLVGPLPQSASGLTHLLTVVDRSTRWAEAILLRSTATEACVSALIKGWVARFGIPQRITSDRGPQFTSSLWSELTSRLGVKSQLTSPYHPEANGAVERFHRRLKDALRARLAGSDWPTHLPWVLLGLRVAPREDSGISAAELVYGCALSLPGQFLSGSELPPAAFVRQINSSLPCVASKTQRVHPLTGGNSETPGGGLRLHQGAPNFSGAVPVLPRSISRHSAGQEIFRPRGWRQASGFLRGQLKASPRLGSCGASLCPASWQTQINALSRASLCPAVEAGEGYCGGRTNAAPSAQKIR